MQHGLVHLDWSPWKSVLSHAYIRCMTKVDDNTVTTKIVAIHNLNLFVNLLTSIYKVNRSRYTLQCI